MLISFNITLLSVFMATLIYVVVLYLVDKKKWPELPINSFWKYTYAFPVIQAVWVVIIGNWLLQLFFLINFFFDWLLHGGA